MSIATDEEVFIFEDEEFEIPCDIADSGGGWPTTLGPAKWVMVVACPRCSHGGTVLICDDCKNFALDYQGPTTCMACWFSIHNINKWIKSINPI